MVIRSNETFPTLIERKYLKELQFPHTLIIPQGLLTQALQLGTLITFVNTFYFNYHCKQLLCLCILF
jgi:hypothetical protein